MNRVIIELPETEVFVALRQILLVDRHGDLGLVGVTLRSILDGRHEDAFSILDVRGGLAVTYTTQSVRVL